MAELPRLAPGRTEGGPPVPRGRARGLLASGGSLGDLPGATSLEGVLVEGATIGRALMLTPDHGFLDRRIAQEAATLAARGWRVDVLSTVDAGLRYGDTLADGVRLLGAGAGGQPRSGSFRRALKGRLRVSARPAYRLAEAVKYRISDHANGILKANYDHACLLGPYDAVFAHDIPVLPLAVALKRLWGARLVCDLHEIFPEQEDVFASRTARDYWRRIEAQNLPLADRILCVNEAIWRYVQDRYGLGERTAVVQNAVPFASLPISGPALRDRYPIPPRARVMLFVGTLQPNKGLEELVLGFARAGLDGWVLAFLGSGPLADRLASVVERAKLNGRVFVGYRAHEDELIALAASADVGLLPYAAIGLNQEISTPNKLYEYIQARLPIATSRLPLIAAIIERYGIGGFVDFSTPETIAAGLRRFVDEDLPRISPVVLEQAALALCWQREEGTVLRAVEDVRPATAGAGEPPGAPSPDRA